MTLPLPYVVPNEYDPVSLQSNFDHISTNWPTRTKTVTSLPATAADGTEVYYVADDSNGVVWHLRYRAASSSSYKWEFVGGPPLWGSVDTEQSKDSNSAWQDPSTVGPSVTTPLAGDYLVRAVANMYANGVASTLQMGVASAGADPDATRVAQEYLDTAVKWASLALEFPWTGVAKSTEMRLRYWGNGGAGQYFTVGRRRLVVQPIRVSA